MEFLHPAIWHDHDIDFARWLHPVIWHAALESWQWIHQVAATCNDMPLNSPKRPPYWNSKSGFDFDHITAVDMSFCTSISEILSKSDHPRQKKMTSCRFSRWRISAVLDFRGPVIGSLKSPCTTSYRLSIDTIALNCLVLEKIAFFCILATDRQTDRQTDEQMDSTDALSRCRCRERRLNNWQ